MSGFEEVKTNFGFGLMRLPMKNGEVDYEETNKMVDEFMSAGFTYFDTAHGYLEGKSEIAFRECVAKRYPRSSYKITNKLSAQYFNSEDDIYKIFEQQLEACGVEYFDFYLMHSQSRANYDKFKKCHAYEVAQKLKEQGKVHHVGLSFHDSADYLEMILNEHPEVELVQIQLNYVDFNDPGVQAKKCLEVCNKFGKPVVVMEPVKGGNLVKLPESAEQIFKGLGSLSNASYAIRFACSQEGVIMVLSGMSNLEQMHDNLSYMKDFKPLTKQEYDAIDKVCEIFSSLNLIQCTGCRYCVEGCPMKILIPNLFADLNAKLAYNDWNSTFYYNKVHTLGHGKASACIKCGKCERICPQHLKIRELLEKVAKEFES